MEPEPMEVRLPLTQLKSDIIAKYLGIAKEQKQHAVRFIFETKTSKISFLTNVATGKEEFEPPMS